jgi:hypothetical protein
LRLRMSSDWPPTTQVSQILSVLWPCLLDQNFSNLN